MRPLVRGLVLFAALAALAPGRATPVQPAKTAVIPGFTCATYATLPYPVGLDFDAVGNLYAGNEETKQGKTAIKIRKIPPGGSPVADFGASEFPDPDGVLVDDDGSISGTAGAVLVCGDAALATGQIVAVKPDESVATVWAPSSDMANPNYMARGKDGLLLADSFRNVVMEFVPPGPPVPLISSPSPPYHIAVADDGRIFVSHSDGVIRVYDKDGGLLDGSYATGTGDGASIAIGRGGAFGTDLWVLNPDAGTLSRVASDKTVTQVGTQLPTSVGAITFGPDQALYVASFDDGEVLRIAPAVVVISSFFLPRTLTLTVKNPSSDKDSIVGSGYFDDGGAAVDYTSQPVTIEIGGWKRDVTLTADKKGTKFTFKDDKLNFVLTPRVRKASLGFFTIKISKTPLGALIDSSLPVPFHFRAGNLPDAAGSVRLTNNKYKRGSRRGDIFVPHAFPAHVIVKLGAEKKDSLTYRGGFATGGTAPATLGTVRFEFGGQFALTLEGNQFTKSKKGATYTYKATVGGSKFRVIVDFQADFLTIDASKVELGPLAGDTTDVVFDAGDGNGPYKNVIHLSSAAKGVTRTY